ncbi:hypothetical protein, partial [Pokkaliibacter plantistimulans]|uniref:hypothetical protein n=1 Tax=Pokkaliibacter plantistimulans TaxID=1635171 RepID=UPI002D7793A1
EQASEEQTVQLAEEKAGEAPFEPQPSEDAPRRVRRAHNDPREIKRRQMLETQQQPEVSSQDE